MGTEFSIVVPVYNSARTLNTLFERLKKTLSKITENYEVILVDDGSEDCSWSILKGLHNMDKRFKVFRFMKNFGQHQAMMCGFKYCRGALVITMDDDLQHPPEEIPKLISEINTHDSVDVVNGLPENRKHSAFKNVGSALMNVISKLVFSNQKNVHMSSFRIIRGNIVKEISKSRTRNPAIGHMLLAVTDKVRNIKVKHDKRGVGKSGYRLDKLIKLTFDNILNYSSIPLRLVSFIGFGSFIISFFLAILYLIQYLMGYIKEPGWTTLTLMILFFSGLILFSFGIVGEYLLRMIKEVNSHPQYVIAEREI